ncbi:type II secretion system protein N [Emcibacter sp.]|uniref:type II secretion system protein N n=1 Tax=Emcibacter sp. TaxID=1979954 RepID=UPI002AA83EA3|nr:type II secretion system protein N [Emcibacter sp.]
MRDYLKIGLPVLLVFISALISLMPLRTAMMMGKPAFFGYQRVEGTVWNGKFHYPRIAGQEVRSLAVSLSPSGLLTGRAVTEFRLVGDEVKGDGTLALSLGGTMQLTDAAFDVTLERQAGMVRFQGGIYLSIDRLELTDQGCEMIEGAFRTDLMTPLSNMGLWTVPENTGALTCNNGRIVMAITDGAGEERRQVSFTFDPLQMRLDTDISIRTGLQEVRDKLQQAGFRKRNNNWVWHHQERFGS